MSGDIVPSLRCILSSLLQEQFCSFVCSFCSELTFYAHCFYYSIRFKHFSKHLFLAFHYTRLYTFLERCIPLTCYRRMGSATACTLSGPTGLFCDWLGCST